MHVRASWREDKEKRSYARIIQSSERDDRVWRIGTIFGCQLRAASGKTSHCVKWTLAVLGLVLFLFPGFPHSYCYNAHKPVIPNLSEWFPPQRTRLVWGSARIDRKRFFSLNFAGKCWIRFRGNTRHARMTTIRSHHGAETDLHWSTMPKRSRTNVPPAALFFLAAMARSHTCKRTAADTVAFLVRIAILSETTPGSSGWLEACSLERAF